MAELEQRDRNVTCTIVRGEVLFGIVKLPVTTTRPLSSLVNSGASPWMRTTYGLPQRHWRSGRLWCAATATSQALMAYPWLHWHRCSARPGSAGVWGGDNPSTWIVNAAPSIAGNQYRPLGHLPESPFHKRTDDRFTCRVRTGGGRRRAAIEAVTAFAGRLAPKRGPAATLPRSLRCREAASQMRGLLFCRPRRQRLWLRRQSH